MSYTWADVDYLHYNTQLSQNLINVTVLHIKKYIFEFLLKAMEASTPRQDSHTKRYIISNYKIDVMDASTSISDSHTVYQTRNTGTLES